MGVIYTLGHSGFGDRLPHAHPVFCCSLLSLPFDSFYIFHLLTLSKCSVSDSLIVGKKEETSKGSLYVSNLLFKVNTLLVQC